MKKVTKTKADFNYRTIKTFEDACKKENIDPGKLPDVSMIPESFRNTIINYYKLYIIFKAINNGWVPDWSNWDQYKYFPWFEVKSSGSGFGFTHAHYDFTNADATVGSRLCTESREKAKYIGEKFGAEYEEYLLIKE